MTETVTTTAPATEAPKTPCPKCEGQGYTWGIHYWSDGPGGVQCLCRLCDGTGSYDEAKALDDLLKYKAEAAKAASALESLRHHVALYLTTSEGTLPNPPLAGALGPSSYASTWLEYLKRAARKARVDYTRVTYVCECGENTNLRKDAEPKCRIRRPGPDGIVADCSGKLTPLPRHNAY